MTIDVVIRGRNVAATLGKCIHKAKEAGDVRIFYRDEGSSDESVEIAKQEGALEGEGDSPLVMYLDAASFLEEGFIATALHQMSDEVIGVVGKRRELFPHASSYNLVSDLEMRTDRLFGRDLLLRRQEFEALIDLDGLKFIDTPMCKHDSAQTSWRHWWTREVERGRLLRKNRSKVRQLVDKVWLRGGSVVILFLLGFITAFFNAWGVILWLPAAMALMAPRIFDVDSVARRLGVPNQDAAKYTWHESLRCIPQLIGMLWKQ